ETAVLALSFKIWYNDIQGIRRFTLTDGAPLSWAAVASKLCSLFDLPPGPVQATHIDADGDSVLLFTDEELRDAIALFDGKSVRLNVKVSACTASAPSISSSELAAHAYADFGTVNYPSLQKMNESA
ncbi:hypothetical protein BDK51DRAFT_29556, partial [Blyttiomyces helicus]